MRRIRRGLSSTRGRVTGVGKVEDDWITKSHAADHAVPCGERESDMIRWRDGVQRLLESEASFIGR